MFSIRIADLTVKIDNKYEYIQNMCKKYIIDADEADFEVSASQQDLENERQAADGEYSDGYLESLSIYRKIGTVIPSYNGFIFHSAVIEYGGKAYAFTAKSGTGKSTHILLWRKTFGDKVGIINGDKPIFRFIGDTLYAYGTPWCGKEGFNRNTRAPVGALCFIERAKENSAEVMDGFEFVSRIFGQVFIPEEPLARVTVLELIDRMSKTVPTYKLFCNMEPEAAVTARDAIVK